MIFYVPIAKTLVGNGRSFKFSEDLLVGFFHDVGQHVQTTAVGHPDDDFHYAHFGPLIDGGIQGNDGAFTAFQREAFLANVFGVQKLFKTNRLIQFFQNAAFFVHGNVVVLFGATLLDPGAQPTAFFPLLNVLKLEADVTAVNTLEVR